MFDRSSYIGVCTGSIGARREFKSLCLCIVPCGVWLNQVFREYLCQHRTGDRSLRRCASRLWTDVQFRRRCIHALRCRICNAIPGAANLCQLFQLAIMRFIGSDYDELLLTETFEHSSSEVHNVRLLFDGDNHHGHMEIRFLLAHRPRVGILPCRHAWRRPWLGRIRRCHCSPLIGWKYVDPMHINH